MIAHVAEAGEGRGRVVLQLTARQPSPIALEAAILVARAFHSGIESVFVEDTTLLDIAGFPFAREISLTGRQSRALSPDVVVRQMRAAAATITRRIVALTQAAEIPFQATTMRCDPLEAIASACLAHGPWNVVALAEPLGPHDAGLIERLFRLVPDTTGLIVVGPAAKRATGRIVGIVEDIEHFDSVLRTARRMREATDAARVTMLLIAESDAEAQVMDEAARLSLEADDTVEIIRARVQANAPAMIAEIIRRLHPGFIVVPFGGMVVPPAGQDRILTSVLECPMFLIR